MKELIEQIEQRIKKLQEDPNTTNIGKVSELTLVKMRLQQLILSSVVSSAWYCKISTAKGQWFEIVTGKNEMEVAVKITEKFGKETVYNLIDRYELM